MLDLDKAKDKFSEILATQDAQAIKTWEERRLLLREHLLANKEKVTKDLEVMREKSKQSTGEIGDVLDNLSRYSIGLGETWLSGSRSAEYCSDVNNLDKVRQDIDYTEEALQEIANSIIRLKELIK